MAGSPPPRQRQAEPPLALASMTDGTLTRALRFLSSEDQRRASSASRGLRRAAVAAEPVGLSIVMPIFNALHVGLPIAVRDILAQATFGPAVCPTFELCAADDGSTDGGREWLLALCDALGPRGLVADDFAAGGVSEDDGGGGAGGGGDTSGGSGSSGVAEDDEHNLGGRRAALEGAQHATARGQAQSNDDSGHGGEDNEVGGGSAAAATATSSTSSTSGRYSGGTMPVMPADDVAACVSARFRRLKLISTQKGARGQGAAMNAALAAATGSIVGLMESDDERPPHTFGVLCTALASQAQVDEGKDQGKGSGKGQSKGQGKGKGQDKGKGHGRGMEGQQAAAIDNAATTTTTTAGATPLSQEECTGRYDAVCSQVELISTLPDGTTGRLGANEFGGMQRFVRIRRRTFTRRSKLVRRSDCTIIQ